MGCKGLVIGLISDTHGLLRPEALDCLVGCAQIIHGGDIGGEAILDGLRKLAPVLAVRGNNDREPWAQSLPETATVEAGRHRLFVIHDVKLLDVDPVAAGISAVISGHTHRHAKSTQEGVLYVNPGAAGRRRFRGPVSVGKLYVFAERIEAELIELAV